MEAASQMGVFAAAENVANHLGSTCDGTSSCSAEALSDYVHSVSRSNARFSTPLILAGFSLLAFPSITGNISTSSHAMDANVVHQTWLDIDDYVDTLMISNGPGRRASLDQGLGLLRIAPSLLRSNDLAIHNREILELWEKIRQSIDNHEASYVGHAAPIYGILSASLGMSPLDACRIFAFGAARDTVSAAVRLNLVGPMEGLSILDRDGRVAAEEGLEEGLLGMLRSGECMTREAKLEHWLTSVATCAPVLDTIQPIHDLLSVRLFRT
jgi:urease accessory protein UreF